MSIKGDIIIGSVSHTTKAAGLSRATIVQIVDDQDDKRKANSFPLRQNTIVAPKSITLFTDEE